MKQAGKRIMTPTEAKSLIGSNTIQALKIIGKVPLLTILLALFPLAGVPSKHLTTSQCENIKDKSSKYNMKDYLDMLRGMKAILK